MKVIKGPTPDGFFKKTQPSKYSFGEMSVGDWFIVEGIAAAERAQNAAYNYGLRHGNGFRLSMSKQGEEYCMKRVK